MSEEQAVVQTEETPAYTGLPIGPAQTIYANIIEINREIWLLQQNILMKWQNTGKDK